MNSVSQTARQFCALPLRFAERKGRGIQERQRLLGETPPSIFRFCPSASLGAIGQEEEDEPAIIISHSPSSSTPLGKNIFTSPTILHLLTSSGRRTLPSSAPEWVEEEDEGIEERSRRMKVNSELAGSAGRRTILV